jgi:hypothetical protein
VNGAEGDSCVEGDGCSDFRRLLGDFAGSDPQWIIAVRLNPKVSRRTRVPAAP